MNKKQLPTTGTGWAAIITILAGVVQQLTDGNPATNPDWNYVVPGLITAVGVLTARSKKATSEDVGARDQPGGP
jgi:hypothetical protein